jgi:hypothetical protein
MGKGCMERAGCVDLEDLLGKARGILGLAAACDIEKCRGPWGRLSVILESCLRKQHNTHDSSQITLT